MPYSSNHFLRWPLEPLKKCDYIRTGDSPLKPSARKANYPFRALRYWHAACAIADEANRLNRPADILDHGCKRGTMKQITPDIPDARWIGLDIKVEHEGLDVSGYAEIHQADFDNPLPLEDQSVDIAASLHVLEHLPRVEFSLQEIHRVLRPGGILIVGTPVLPDFLARRREAFFQKTYKEGKRKLGKHLHAFSPKSWRRYLEDTGYEIDFLFGSHFYRQSGMPLENKEWWVRLNQRWGLTFPALGRDIIVQARRKR